MGYLTIEFTLPSAKDKLSQPFIKPKNKSKYQEIR